jgi:exodeoxyribonuclease V alpha subunit
MQRVNNYDKNVFNGDVGNIIDIDKENQAVTILYPEGPVEYDFADMDQLVHAFSQSIHKSQGSEYPACIIAIHTQHYTMLQRNLIYTALTRAKKLAVFVGSKRAIHMAVRNRNVVPRNTRLAQRLQMLVEDFGSTRRPAAKSARTDLPTPPLPGRLL